MKKRKYHKYRIQRYDSLIEIYRTVGATIPLVSFIDELKKANSWTLIPQLYVGDKIKIPKEVCSEEFNTKTKWLFN